MLQAFSLTIFLRHPDAPCPDRLKRPGPKYSQSFISQRIEGPVKVPVSARAAVSPI